MKAIIPPSGVRGLKITVIGGGPGGLYFSILTKKAMPHCQIDIYERNKPVSSENTTPNPKLSSGLLRS